MTIKSLTALFLGVIVFSFTGCKVNMKPGGEIISTDKALVEKEGKSLWMTYRDSNGEDYELYDIHKIKFTTYKYPGKKKTLIEYFDRDGNPLKASSELGFSKIVNVSNNKGQLIEEHFEDENGELMTPQHTGYAKKTTMYQKDGSWIENYFDDQNNKSCEYRAYEIHLIYDTIWQFNKTDTTYLLSIKTLEEKTCDH